MKLVVLLGPTGSGKSVQAEALVGAHPSWSHFSSGDLLRSDPVAQEAIATGRLVPSQEVERIVSQALLGSTAPVILLDGFPRTVDQVHWLDRLMLDNDISFAGALVFDVDKATVLERLAKRGRNDDAATAIETKWRAYETEVVPVIRYYDAEGSSHHFDGSLSVEELRQQVEATIDV